MGYWDDVAKWGGLAGGGVGGFFLGGPAGAIGGASLGYQVGSELGQSYFPDKPPQLNTRPSLGLEGQAAAQEQARAMQSILNQNLMGTTVPMINREYAGAGRYASGQRLGAIGQATQQSQGMLGQQIGMNALQVYLAQLGAQEERDWRQAQLDLAGTQQPSAWGSAGELAPYLLQYYLSRQGDGAPTGGGSAALTQSYAGYR
jgi:hypothetical protein